MFSNTEKRNKSLPQRIILYTVTNENDMVILGEMLQNPQPCLQGLNVSSRAQSLLRFTSHQYLFIEAIY